MPQDVFWGSQASCGAGYRHAGTLVPICCHVISEELQLPIYISLAHARPSLFAAHSWAGAAAVPSHVTGCMLCLQWALPQPPAGVQVGMLPVPTLFRACWIARHP